jgi:N-acetyl-anhydromuramyl-L-alanine amidase AmpD
MTRVICHWTAGGYSASVIDKEHYHIIWEGNGNVVRGDHSIDDNVNTADDDYAAHAKGCNTGSIGVSLACMLDAIESPFNAGRYPMTRTQFDAMTSGVAQLCTFYGIAVTPKTVLSHGEVENTLGIKQAGKWDYTRLAFDPSLVGQKACGDYLRAEVAAKLKAA